MSTAGKSHGIGEGACMLSPIRFEHYLRRPRNCAEFGVTLPKFVPNSDEPESQTLRDLPASRDEAPLFQRRLNYGACRLSSFEGVHLQVKRDCPRMPYPQIIATRALSTYLKPGRLA